MLKKEKSQRTPVNLFHQPNYLKKTYESPYQYQLTELEDLDFAIEYVIDLTPRTGQYKALSYSDRNNEELPDSETKMCL